VLNPVEGNSHTDGTLCKLNRRCSRKIEGRSRPIQVDEMTEKEFRSGRDLKFTFNYFSFLSMQAWNIMVVW
jgi:hypothetical protein